MGMDDSQILYKSYDHEDESKLEPETDGQQVIIDSDSESIGF